MRFEEVARSAVQFLRNAAWKTCVRCDRDVVETFAGARPSPFLTQDISSLPTHVAASFEYYSSTNTPLPRNEYVREIQQATVVEPTYGWAICPHLRTMRESLPYTYYARAPRLTGKYLARRSARGPRLPVAISMHDVGVGNYYHLFFEFLGKLALAERLGADNRIPLLVPAIQWRTRFVREAIQLLGLEGREWRIQDQEYVSVEKLTIVHPVPADVRTAEWIRKRLTNEMHARPDGLRLFVRRDEKVGRGLANEQPLLDIMKRYGFVAVDTATLSVREQVGLFSRANRIVAVHGAGLANLIFAASSDVRVLELFPAYNIPPMFAWLAIERGLQYRALVGSPYLRPAESDALVDKRAFAIDVKQFHQTVRELIS